MPAIRWNDTSKKIFRRKGSHLSKSNQIKSVFNIRLDRPAVVCRETLEMHGVANDVSSSSSSSSLVLIQFQNCGRCSFLKFPLEIQFSSLVVALQVISILGPHVNI